MTAATEPLLRESDLVAHFSSEWDVLSHTESKRPIKILQLDHLHRAPFLPSSSCAIP